MRKVTILYPSVETLLAFNEVFRFITVGCDPDIEFATTLLPRSSRVRTWEDFVNFDNLRNSSYVLELGLHHDIVLVKCHKKRYDHDSEFRLCDMPNEMLKFFKNDFERFHIDPLLN